jgi:hypothetical protein
MSKPYQQRLIAQYGFQVPRTLVTMVPAEACMFYDECQGRVIYKSISAERSIVKPLMPEDFPRLEQIRYCPVQLQETIPGTDLRIHTVGDRLFATEVLSDGVDYVMPHVKTNNARCGRSNWPQAYRPAVSIWLKDWD